MADDLIVTDEALEDPLVLKRLLADIIERLSNTVREVPDPLLTKYILEVSQNGGSALVVQDNSIELANEVNLFNFIGFNLTQPFIDEITITFGTGITSEYCPGYTFSFVNTTVWNILGLNVINLFHINRRLKFVDGSNKYFGTITTSIFTSGNTEITMDMEGGDVLTNTIGEVCLTAGTAGWSPIAGDPFNGRSINDICIGDINGVTWLFAVGDQGKCAVSNDGGLLWNILISGTNENLNVCVYDSLNETFWGGGNEGVLVSTKDAISIILDITSINGLGSDNGSYKISGFAYNSGENGLLCISDVNISASWSIYSINQGATWILGGSIGGLAPENMHTVKSQVNGDESTGLTLRAAMVNATEFRDAMAGVTDTSWATGSNTLHPISAIAHFAASGSFVIMSGSFDGHIIGTFSWTGDDTTTFSERVRAFAFSSLHNRLICVGDNAQLGYLDDIDKTTNDAWTFISNGFNPLANILSIVWDDNHGVFIAVADNGQICRSSNGIN